MGLSLLYYFVAISMFVILQWKWKKLSFSILIPYLFLILSTTIFSRQPIDTSTYNPMLLKFLRADNEWSRHDYLREMWANAIMFIPFGFLIPQVFRRKNEVRVIINVMSVCLTIAVSLILSIGIEYMQLRLKRGYSESDDILSNMIGVLIGIVIYVIVSIVKKKIETHKQTDSYKC